jgi:cupin superfamily acireductone dioxygenase involved in methionine salvage
MPKCKNPDVFHECLCGAHSMKKVIEQMEDKFLPFTEERISYNEIIRTFESKYPDHLFKWHQDDEDRIIEALEDTDWRFQFDNEIPITLQKGRQIKIPKGVYHRLIKGNDNSIRIKVYL